MPERIQKLRQTLQELEEELASLTTVDDPTRQMLEEAIGEIQSALRVDDPTQFETPRFTERLQEAAERFESTHPTLFGVLSRTIDALGQMGI